MMTQLVAAHVFPPLAIIAILTVVTYYCWSYTYWKRRGLEYIKPTFPLGTFGVNPFTRKDILEIVFKKQYDEFKRRGLKHGGSYILTDPFYLPVDPDVIKDIMTKNFQHFVDHGTYFNERDDPLSANVFNLEGAKWRNRRIKLSPTFTTNKLKGMFSVVAACSKKLDEAMTGYCLHRTAVETKDLLARFTIDVIATCGFGIECDPFRNSSFRSHGKEIFEFSVFRFYFNLFTVGFPRLSRKLGFKVFPEVSGDFFKGVFQSVVAYRETSETVRKDFMQTLIDMKNGPQKLTFNEVAADALFFFAAGFETSSTTMCLCLYELACHQEIQERVRREIKDVLKKHDGEFTYEAIKEMKYFQQVLEETLRKYPALPSTTRKCTLDYTVPGTDVTIEKGTMVSILIYAIHHDSEYYPQPEKFDPDRFTPENKATRHPYNYMPFGQGPRTCLGLRIAMMMMKTGVAVLLNKYKFCLSSNTDIPLRMHPQRFFLAPFGGVWLNVERADT